MQPRLWVYRSQRVNKSNPEWNRRVKELYKKSRNCDKVWINEGRNRFEFNYEEMKESK